jgi:hypothetical protein
MTIKRKNIVAKINLLFLYILYIFILYNISYEYNIFKFLLYIIIVE